MCSMRKSPAGCKCPQSPDHEIVDALPIGGYLVYQCPTCDALSYVPTVEAEPCEPCEPCFP